MNINEESYGRPTAAYWAMVTQETLSASEGNDPKEEVRVSLSSPELIWWLFLFPYSCLTMSLPHQLGILYFFPGQTSM